jgi:hypothetical protein
LNIASGWPPENVTDVGPFKLVPGKILVFVAAGDEETVHFIDLRKMHDTRHFPPRQRAETLAQG